VQAHNLVPEKRAISNGTIMKLPMHGLVFGQGQIQLNQSGASKRISHLTVTSEIGFIEPAPPPARLRNSKNDRFAMP
jgi:hypothetical protein